jgi:hypothetical protein
MCEFDGKQRLFAGGIVMDNLRCPNLDLLGFRLIEAYRRLGDVELDAVSSSDQTEAQLAMSSIEQEIRSHRENCFLCREIRWKTEMVKAFSKSEPAWRGTMAS